MWTFMTKSPKTQKILKFKIKKIVRYPKLATNLQNIKSMLKKITEAPIILPTHNHAGKAKNIVTIM